MWQPRRAKVELIWRVVDAVCGTVLPLSAAGIWFVIPHAPTPLRLQLCVRRHGAPSFAQA